MNCSTDFIFNQWKYLLLVLSSAKLKANSMHLKSALKCNQTLKNITKKNHAHRLFSSSNFLSLFFSDSSWAWNLLFSCLKREFWDSTEDIWVLLARSSSVAARSLSTAAASKVWDSPDCGIERKPHIKHLRDKDTKVIPTSNFQWWLTDGYLLPKTGLPT